MKAAAAVLTFLSVFMIAYNRDFITEAFSRRVSAYFGNINFLIKRSVTAVKTSELIRFEILIFAAGVVISLMAGSIYLFFFFIPMIFVLPRVYLKIRHKKYIKDYYAGLIGFLETLISGLRAGMSLTGALRMFTEREKNAVAREIRVVLSKVEFGKSLSGAFAELGERVNIKENEIIISAINTSIETGANLTEILDNVLHTIRKRDELNGEIKTLTSQGVMSGIITGLLPFLLAGIIFVMDPDFILPLFNTAAGMALLGAAFIMEIAGALIIKKITDIR